MTERVGTPIYVAPEVLEGSHTESCDYWSLGVITYILVCGYPPFNHENESALYNLIRTCDYSYDKKDWEKISAEARDFIDKFLNPNPKTRMRPQEALSHPWILKNAPNSKLDG
jgi:calcium-dependent protein kinase